VRFWDELDPTMRAVYEIDPQWTDLMVLASHDADYPSNVHNLIMTTNLPAGVDPPAGAVTNIDFYQRGLGMVASRDVDAEFGTLDDFYDVLAITGARGGDAAPDAIAAIEAYPNPFNPATTIRYVLASPAAVTVTVHDAVGRLVQTLAADAWRDTGPHAITWRGADHHGRPVGSGTYFCRVRAAGTARTLSMTLVR
jgi:hypothetical protein